jgi:hypothetical protein
VSIPALRAVAAALDARLVLEIRWRAGDFDRLLDSGHALLIATLIERLRLDGWECRVEVSYALPRAQGSIDVLAWRAQQRALLVVEVKTAIPSAEATLRKLDEKVGIAAQVARDRFGWAAAHVAKLLVVDDTSTNRRRIAAHDVVFQAALPSRAAALRRWLGDPLGPVEGLLFLPPSDHGAVIRKVGGQHRVRAARSRPKRSAVNVSERLGRPDQPPEDRFPSILVGYERRDR